MDKSTYLKQLETALRGKYAEPQVKDILADYEDFFASGAAEGKSEAELCAEFGPPGQAAIELKGEDKTEPPRRKVNRTVLSRVLLAGLILAVLWPFFGPELHVSSGWSALPEGRSISGSPCCSRLRWKGSSPCGLRKALHRKSR